MINLTTEQLKQLQKIELEMMIEFDRICRKHDTTIRAALEQAEIDYARGGVSLDGCPLQTSDFDKTFTEKGITEKCFLLQVVKADNANA